MDVSNAKAFFLGSGFGLKVEGFQKDAISNKEKGLHLLLSVLFSVATAGIFVIAGPLIGRMIHNKRYAGSELEKKTSESAVRILNLAKDSNRERVEFDFSKVTPDNIEALFHLDTKWLHSGNQREGDVSIVKKEGGYEFTITKKVSASKENLVKERGLKIDRDETEYKGQQAILAIKENRFELANRESFENLKEFLDYIFEERIYKGDSITLRTRDGKDAIYKNPYKKE